VAFQKEIVAAIGKEKMKVNLFSVPPEMEEAVAAFATGKILDALNVTEKLAREDRIEEIRAEWLAQFEEDSEEYSLAKEAFSSVLRQVVRKRILEEGIRPDGRKPDEIRPVYCKAGLMPRL